MKTRYLIILLFCLMTRMMQAQTHYLFQRFNVAHGLSSNYVNGLTQDRTGCIWIATEGGLTRFDGSRMTAYTTSNSHLPCNEISAVLADTARNLLCVATKRNGLCLFDENGLTMNVITTAQGLLSNEVQHLSPAADGGIWVTHRQGISHFDLDTRQSVPYSSATYKGLEGEFTCTCDDRSGQLYVGTVQHGLYVIDLKKHRIRNFRHQAGHSTTLPNDHVLTIFIDRSGRVWVGTSNGLALFQPQSGSFTAFLRGGDAYGDRLLGNQVNDIGQSTDGTLWVCTHRGGVNTLNLNDYSFDSEEEIYFNTIGFTGDQHGLSSPNARCFLQDRFGNIWIGNYRGGVDFISYERPPFRTLDYGGLRDGNYTSSQVWGLAVDCKGRIWLGGENELAVFRESGEKRIIPFGGIAQPLTHASVIYEDSHGLLWIGLHQDGVLTCQPDNGRLTRIPMPKTGFDVGCFCEDAEGRMLIGTQTGIYSYHRGEVSCEEEFNKPLHGRAVHGIVIDAQSNYWIGTFEQGLLKFNAQKKLIGRIDQSNGLGSNAVNSIYLDRAGGLWVAHRGGVAYIADTAHPHPELYAADRGLNNLNVRAITADLRGRIWLSTNAGISQWNAQRQRFYNYNHRQGVPLGDFMDGSVCADAKGRIFFGSQNGACYFNPSEISHSETVIPVSITDVKVYNNSSSSDHNDCNIPFHNAKIVLSHRQNTFRISFNVMDYTLGRQAEYEYQMQGLGRNRFLLDNENQVIFRDLDPGRYTFKVRAKLRNQEWNDSFTTLQIIIRPPLWLTWYAKLFYFVLLCGTLYGFLLFYKRRLELENRLELEHQQLENNQQLHNERMRFFTNITHELRTPLTLILGPLEDLLADSTLSPRHANKISIIRDSATRLLNLINQILEFRKTETQNRQLLISRGDLGGLAQEIGTRFQELNRNEKVQVCIEVPEVGTEFYFDREVLTIIINNLLSNALKYTPEGRVTLRVDALTRGTQRYIRLQVSDTGYGIASEALPHIFQRYYQEGGEHQASGSGIGLALVKSLVDLHEGIITVESRSGEGTTFTLLLLRDNTYPHARHEELPSAPTTEALSAPAEADHDSSKPLLLVVEDNVELCAYLRSSFEENWQVLTAYNGQEGWQLAQERIPNLIVSDIMMPVMDGIALCRLLKGDIRTSHIPVILLTAKGSIRDKEEGYEAGADSFITKPFSARLLQLRMENLLASRRKLASFITAVATQEGAPVASVEVASDDEPASAMREEGDEAPRLTKLDQLFLDKVKAIILDHLSMEKMDVAFIADKMCMSHSTLYRKIKGLTNMTVNEFVRKLKMQKSLELLRQGELSIAEISDRTGFSSVTYFRQCFKDEFGMSPSEYVKRKSQDNK